ncbi:hypothetical protein [Amycolatopsis magusensis]|uniref:hypothetical protein n=1 Tax=Amycolatopsis magusensis TaxID=882444 RepID=UPI0037979FEF
MGVLGKIAAVAAVAFALSPGVAAAAGEPHVLTDVFVCDYDTASGNGYLYVRNDGSRITCFANRGSAGVHIGNSAYWCSHNNAGFIEYTRPDIVRGTIYFNKWQCGGFDQGTTVTRVNIY